MCSIGSISAKLLMYLYEISISMNLIYQWSCSHYQHHTLLQCAKPVFFVKGFFHSSFSKNQNQKRTGVTLLGLRPVIVFTIWFIVRRKFIKNQFIKLKIKFTRNHVAHYLPLLLIPEKRHLTRHFLKIISCQQEHPQIHVFSICM